MKFRIFEVKNGHLLNPAHQHSPIDRRELIIDAKSKLEALRKFGGSTNTIYWNGRNPYYRPYDNVKYIASLHKPYPTNK